MHLNKDRETPTVLVVDDDITVRLLAHESLSSDGFTVVEAEDGAQALTVFQEMRPDIVLMDVEMPNLDGFAACKQLREFSYGRQVPILMITGYDDMDSIHNAYQAGATDFAAKPLNWLILGYRLRYMLRASHAFQALQKEKARLAQAQRIARLGSWEWDLETGAVYWSEQVYRLLSLTPGTVAPTLANFLKWVHPNDRATFRAWFANVLRGRISTSTYRIVLPEATERNLEIQAEAQVDAAGHTVEISGTVQDITERQQAEEKIHRLAYYDTLTGLANRRLFKERMEQVLGLARRYKRLAAVLFLDLDDFKRINDTLGHDVGDLLLKTVAGVLLASTRNSDVTGRSQAVEPIRQVARLGGDEFTVLLSEIQQVSDTETVARRILESLARPVTLAGHDVVVTPSIGIAVFPYDGEEVEVLLKHADIAMYHAKKAGKNLYQFYAASMNVAAQRRLKLENALRKALERGEFHLEYQPQVDLWQGPVVGVEALLRWHNKELGRISPGEFIPLAEETGLILPIGDWVLREACAQIKVWQTEGLPRLRVAVNLSPRQFAQKDLPEKVAAILRETGLDPDCLELEITEGLLMQDVEEGIRTLHQLKALGVHLAIDDFGTGYSSLSYLKRFPIDRLKIDRSFVNNITSDPNDAAVALAVMAMAHSLKLNVTAEGVETEAQQTFLKDHYCDEVQGYYISHPVPSREFMEIIRAYERRRLEAKTHKPEQRTLLLLDDEPNVTAALKRTLHNEGYQVITANDTTAAFNLLATRYIDVVVSDQSMPDMKGTEFLRRVREIYPQTVRLVLSGRSDMNTAIQAINEGAIFKFLTKPVDESTLKSTLREAFLLAEGRRVQ